MRAGPLTPPPLLQGFPGNDDPRKVMAWLDHHFRGAAHTPPPPPPAPAVAVRVVSVTKPVRVENASGDLGKLAAALTAALEKNIARGKGAVVFAAMGGHLAHGLGLTSKSKTIRKLLEAGELPDFKYAHRDGTSAVILPRDAVDDWRPAPEPTADEGPAAPVKKTAKAPAAPQAKKKADEVPPEKKTTKPAAAPQAKKAPTKAPAAAPQAKKAPAKAPAAAPQAQKAAPAKAKAPPVAVPADEGTRKKKRGGKLDAEGNRMNPAVLRHSRKTGGPLSLSPSAASAARQDPPASALVDKSGGSPLPAPSPPLPLPTSAAPVVAARHVLAADTSAHVDKSGDSRSAADTSALVDKRCDSRRFCVRYVPEAPRPLDQNGLIYTMLKSVFVNPSVFAELETKWATAEMDDSILEIMTAADCAEICGGDSDAAGRIMCYLDVESTFAVADADGANRASPRTRSRGRRGKKVATPVEEQPLVYRAKAGSDPNSRRLQCLNSEVDGLNRRLAAIGEEMDTVRRANVRPELDAWRRTMKSLRDEQGRIASDRNELFDARHRTTKELEKQVADTAAARGKLPSCIFGRTIDIVLTELRTAQLTTAMSLQEEEMLNKEIARVEASRSLVEQYHALQESASGSKAKLDALLSTTVAKSAALDNVRQRIVQHKAVFDRLEAEQKSPFPAMYKENGEIRAVRDAKVEEIRQIKASSSLEPPQVSSSSVPPGMELRKASFSVEPQVSSSVPRGMLGIELPTGGSSVVAAPPTFADPSAVKAFIPGAKRPYVPRVVVSQPRRFERQDTPQPTFAFHRPPPSPSTHGSSPPTPSHRDRRRVDESDPRYRDLLARHPSHHPVPVGDALYSFDTLHRPFDAADHGGNDELPPPGPFYDYNVPAAAAPPAPQFVPSQTYRPPHLRLRPTTGDRPAPVELSNRFPGVAGAQQWFWSNGRWY